MTVSADKIQFILETALEESIPLVKRGIFSQQELKEIMHKRQKLQKGMLKMEYKITDYLAAIEYEYELERLRRFRMDSIAKIQNGNINPTFKKQSSSDFAIIKRIIRLWDKTMHKYRFKTDIWKQYFQFCVTIGSKKHFYKALTKSLRFIPFQVDLWKIGVEYQKEHGHNYWKARKILLKGLKMIPAGLRNIQLGKYMITFQLQFVKRLQERNNIISKAQEGMQFINEHGQKQNIDAQIDLKSDEQQHSKHEDEEMGENFNSKDKKELNNINLDQYHEIIWLVIQEIIQKNTNNNTENLKQKNIIKQIYSLLNSLFAQNKQIFLRNILTNLKNKLNQSYHEEDKIQELQIQDNLEDNDIKQEEVNQEFNGLIHDNSINFEEAEKLIKKNCLKVQQSEKIFSFMAHFDFIATFKYLNHARFSIKLPNKILSLFLQRYLQSEELGEQKQILNKYLINQIDKKTEASDYKNNIQLLKLVLTFNNQENRYENTTKLIRSLTVNYKKEPSFLQTCHKLCNSLN